MGSIPIPPIKHIASVAEQQGGGLQIRLTQVQILPFAWGEYSVAAAHQPVELGVWAHPPLLAL